MGELNFAVGPTTPRWAVTPTRRRRRVGLVRRHVWLHGYEPRALPATTDLMLKHKHPGDALRAFEVLESVTHDGVPFSCYHPPLGGWRR